MSVTSKLSENQRDLRISVKDRFDFSLHQQFRDAYANHKITGAQYTIDLSQTTYMDSSALGMILLLKDHVESLKGKLIIDKPNSSVKKILEIAQFHRLMDVVE